MKLIANVFAVMVFIVFSVVFIYAVGFMASGGDLAIYSFWAPKQADAQREVFSHTQSYVQGKIQNIGQECSAYQAAEGLHKLALANEIRNEAATISITMLPRDEQVCVAEAREQ